MIKNNSVNLSEANLKKVIAKAIRRVEKLIREEPRIIIMSHGDENIPNPSKDEIRKWLFNIR